MIWLIGNKGMLGTELSLCLEKADLPFTGTDREVDITDSAIVRDFIMAQPVDWIINCAAYTAVDRAEDDKESCSLLNIDGPQNIASQANKTGAGFIHISTDYVFDGKGSRPYTEEDQTSPIGIYGLSKRDGENKVLANNPSSYIIRTAWLYGKYGNNFVHTMLKLMKEQNEIKVVHDQKGSPTWARDLSMAIIALLQYAAGGKNIPAGIYHYTGEGTCSWFEFAGEIYRQARTLGILTKDCIVRPCASAEYPAKVKRPAYSVLDKTKIKKNLELTIPDWQTSIKKYLQIMAGDK